MAETIEINGTEVVVEETDGGYEAREKSEEVFAIKATDEACTKPYGFIIPLDEVDQFEIEMNAASSSSSNEHYAAWNTEADVGDMKSNGSRNARKSGYDGHAAVSKVELVTIEE